jgi:hypothetical protein
MGVGVHAYFLCNSHILVLRHNALFWQMDFGVGLGDGAGFGRICRTRVAKRMVRSYVLNGPVLHTSFPASGSGGRDDDLGPVAGAE